MTNYILVSNKRWHDDLFNKLNKREDVNWIKINEKKDFNIDIVSKINPKIIFIAHWSNFISTEIFTNYECILFHMTNLPYGRGGSPLQNLIVRGHKKTKISAIKVVEGIDEGPIYLKKEIKLEGSATEIFNESSLVIYEMILEILKKPVVPITQKGKVTLFKRRNPNQSDISNLKHIDIIYDYIRMLDCEGYPNAFIELNGIKYEFTNVKKDYNSLKADVRIKKN